jgi:hypothetical protein
MYVVIKRLYIEMDESVVEYTYTRTHIHVHIVEMFPEARALGDRNRSKPNPNASHNSNIRGIKNSMNTCINDLKLRLHMWCKVRYIHVRVDVTDMQRSFT